MLRRLSSARDRKKIGKLGFLVGFSDVINIVSKSNILFSRP